MKIVEERLLEDIDCENKGMGGYLGMTIKQRYWEELYTGICEDDYYDYN